jgi:F0F1-type ATP synthase assembly protein I
MSAALTMSWELLLAVLVPVIGGSQLDKSFGTKHLYTFIGLGLAVLGSAVVMRHTVRLVNRFPVPTLSAAQRRAIKKQYDDEDDN